MKLGEISEARDPTLQDPNYEAKRAEARKVMKIARMQMSCEGIGWDKTLSKYEAKLVKGDTLTQAARTLVESASKLSQETVNNNLSLVLAALDQLV